MYLYPHTHTLSLYIYIYALCIYTYIHAYINIYIYIYTYTRSYLSIYISKATRLRRRFLERGAPARGPPAQDAWPARARTDG